MNRRDFLDRLAGNQHASNDDACAARRNKAASMLAFFKENPGTPKVA